MKKMLLAICLVLVMASIAFGQTCSITDWTINGCPSWTCPQAPDPSNPPTACYPVTLGEMGSFNAADEWTYDQTYINQMAAWGPNNASRLPEAWMPYRHLVFSGNPGLQSHFRSDGSKATRVNFNLPGKVTEWPDVYRWVKADGSHLAFVASFTSNQIPGSDCSYPNGPPAGPCTYPSFTKNNPETVPFESIQGIYWVEKNLLSNTPVLTNLNQMQVSMEVSAPIPCPNPPCLPPPPNYSPIYGKFNFWQSPTSFPAPVGKVMARWPGLVPDKNTVTTIQININGKTYDLVFAGGDTENIPPIIPTTDVNPKGKIIQNRYFLTTEENGNLVIQWRTQQVTTPYMNLYVYVGSSWPADTIPTEAWFAWIEAVPQSSIVVLPKASWDFIKNTLSTKGYPKAQIMIIYQHQYAVPPSVPPIPPSTFTPYGTTFQIRGQSDIVEILY